MLIICFSIYYNCRYLQLCAFISCDLSKSAVMLRASDDDISEGHFAEK